MLKERIFRCHGVWPLEDLIISTQMGLD
uniref:Uncharacterized protein n=1 Tax=Moniliophthora roreri TaxID=221103 RepID=A0A0W0FK23_MONRR